MEGGIAQWEVWVADTKARSRYKGMASHTSTTNLSANSTAGKAITPQSTGFSQIHARGGGEGGGQAMSVMLSWHEKVRRSYPGTPQILLGVSIDVIIAR